MGLSTLNPQKLVLYDVQHICKYVLKALAICGWLLKFYLLRYFFYWAMSKKKLSWKNQRQNLASWLGAHRLLKFSEIKFLMLTLRSCCFCNKFDTLVWKDLLHCMILIYSLLFLVSLKWRIIQSCNPTKVQYSTWKNKIVTL